jgi:hypothetical protein
MNPKRVHMSCVFAASNTESESSFKNGAKACSCEWKRAWVCSASKRMVSSLAHVSSLDFGNLTHMKFV